MNKINISSRPSLGVAVNGDSLLAIDSSATSQKTRLLNFSGNQDDFLTGTGEWVSSEEISAQGQDGASAYEVAVANGYIGTEEEWLASLVGPQGADGADGLNGDGATLTGNFIEFISTGATFSPLITLEGEATVEWVFDDGDTSSDVNPTKDYRCAATRSNKLTVTPWSALVGINLGYARQDGGWPSASGFTMAVHPVTPVSEVRNLSLASASLIFFCASNNDAITALDFTGFSVLQDIECYDSGALTEVKTYGCTALRRLCLESAPITWIDLTDSLLFEDLRAASCTNLDNVTYGSEKPNLWHICHRENTGFKGQYLYENMASRPVIRDLWIHNLNQSGDLVVPSTGQGFTLWGYNNNWTSADFTGAMLVNTDNNSLNFTGTPLESLTIDGCVGLTTLICVNNALPSSQVDSILAELVTLGRTGGTVTINGTGNEGPTSAGTASAATLTSRGWTVSLNAEVSDPVLTITTTSLGSVVVDTPYSLALQAINGVDPLTWAVTVGTLPTGLSLNTSTGEISGTPTTEESYSFTITVTDDDLNTDTQDFSGSVTTEATSGIEIVNYAGNPTANQANTLQIDLTVGNLVAVCVGVFNGSITNVTDNLGNTYTPVASSFSDSDVDMQWFVAPVTTGGTATITFNNTGSYWSITAVQLSGVDLADPVDVAAAATTGNTGAISTTQADTILLVSAHKNGDASTGYTWSPEGCTQLLGNYTTYTDRPVAYQVFDSIQSDITPGLNSNGDSVWNITAVALKAA